jgi:hypothetical protein
VDPRIPPWITRSGGPAHLWRLYFDSGKGALELAEFLGELCLPRHVTLDIRGVDEYAGRQELYDVRGVLFVLTEQTADPQRTGNLAMFERIERDFRALHPVDAVDGFRPDSDTWHRVAVLVMLYTDPVLDNPACVDLLRKACASYVYTPGTPFVENVFEVFEAGKAQLVKDSDQVVTDQTAMWKYLRRWGVDSPERARLARHEVEGQIDAYDDPAKPALYRPIPGLDHNQLWLVLYDGETRPAIDPDKTAEENQKAETTFVANGARVVRDVVTHLEASFDWFHQPEDLKRRGAQRHFARLYDFLRTVTRGS